MAGPGDEIAAAEGRRDGHLRASHGDREQAIGTLKTAFAHGMLAKDEFDLRVGQAFASRTYAELAAVTAGLSAEPTAAQPPRPARAPGEQPVLRPGRVIMVTTALYAGVWPFTFLVPWPTNSEGDLPDAIAALFVSTTVIYLFVLVVAVGYMIAGWHKKHSRGRPPRRPAPGAGGQASCRPPSAGAVGELPPTDGGMQRTAEAARSHHPRQQSSGSCPPRRWRYRGRGYTIGYAGD
jgi:hypothetical protein